MNNVFVISDRSTVIARGIWFTGVGLIFLTVPLVNGAWQVWLFGITVCSIIMFNTCRDAVGTVYEIRVAADGTVEFLRLRDSLLVSAREIHGVQGVRMTDSYGDNVSWHMYVMSDRGSFTVDFFGRAMELVADLQEWNPNLRVDGEWPVLNPWDPRLGGHFGPR